MLGTQNGKFQWKLHILCELSSFSIGNPPDQPKRTNGWTDGWTDGWNWLRNICFESLLRLFELLNYSNNATLKLNIRFQFSLQFQWIQTVLASRDDEFRVFWYKFDLFSMPLKCMCMRMYCVRAQIMIRNDGDELNSLNRENVHKINFSVKSEHLNVAIRKEKPVRYCVLFHYILSSFPLYVFVIFFQQCNSSVRAYYYKM